MNLSHTGSQLVKPSLLPNTIQQSQDDYSKIEKDPATQANYLKMEVKLGESQRGGKWKWEGSITGRGHDVLNLFARRADQ